MVTVHDRDEPRPVGGLAGPLPDFFWISSLRSLPSGPIGFVGCRSEKERADCRGVCGAWQGEIDGL